MQIRRIKIGGFKNIDNVELELSDITSLISINSYGKSNFLDAVRFGINFLSYSGSEKNDAASFILNVPFNKKNYYGNFHFEIEIDDVQTDLAESIIYGYEFSWKKDDKHPEIVNEYLKVKEVGSQKYSNYIWRDEKKVLYKPSIKARCSKETAIGWIELVLNKLTAFDDLFYLDIVKCLSSLRMFIDRNFDTSRQYTFDVNLYNIFTDSSRESSVPEILFGLKKNYKNKYDVIMNTIMDIFPFIKDISVNEYEIGKDLEYSKRGIKKLCALFVLDEHNELPIYFENMSDGVRRVLTVFLSIVLADINNIPLIAIEEPENSLNPRILQRYLIALKSFAKNTKILITSHSPYLVNYLMPQNILIGVPNRYGLVDFSKIRKSAINKLLSNASSMDMLVGDYLFDLMSGDEEDLKTLQSYVE